MITEDDKTFLAYVKKNRHIGYGRMMQIISNEWSCIDGRGAQVAITCLAELPELDVDSFNVLRDREVREGMKYGNGAW